MSVRSIGVTAGSLTRLPSPPFHSQPRTFTNVELRLLHLSGHTFTGRRVRSLTLDKARTRAHGTLALLPSRAFCGSRLVFGRSRRVSTPRPRCARSRPPAGGGCDAASGDAGGSGGTCDSAARRSGVACPAPNPHRGSPRPPRPTRGHWCMEGFRCLPVGSWCCNLENEHNKQAAEEGGDVLADFCRHWEALPPLD